MSESGDFNLPPLSPEQLRAIVQAFNDLPQNQTTPGGLLNHWYFSVRHVPLCPPGDLVHFIHPSSGLTHCEGPRQILSLPSLEDQVDVIAPLLLNAFIWGLGGGPNGERVPKRLLSAPLSWSTKDQTLAVALGKKLQSMGVRQELCSIGWGNGYEDGLADDSWSEILRELGQIAHRELKTEENDMIFRGVNNEFCHGCKKMYPSKSLQPCLGCFEVYYCSRKCEMWNQAEHLQACGGPSSVYPGNSAISGPDINSMSALKYYNEIAHRSSEAQALASSLNLSLPKGEDVNNVIQPVRRLVITGEDTLENLELLLGPNWKESAGRLHEVHRLDVILRASLRSKSHGLFSKMDADTPAWSPRAANDTEKDRVRAIRHIQFLMRQNSCDDTEHSFPSFGYSPDVLTTLYEVAVNTMD